ncbi:MAG: glycosyltransferase [Cyanobacteriota bacterium]|nr:glycosyltransferase [Cyanobacteriota bacterium]
MQQETLFEIEHIARHLLLKQLKSTYFSYAPISMLKNLEFIAFFLLANSGTTLLYLFINPEIDYILYIVSVAAIVLFASIRLLEHLISLPTEFNQSTSTLSPNYSSSHSPAKLNQFTVIIPAYLPAEQDIILETINYFISLKLPFDIILAYNTPKTLPIEKQIRKLPIRSFKVPNSSSKAENINYILQRITTQYVAIFDADHAPLSENFSKALYWLTNGYDIVQGACLPLPNSPLAQFLSVEFNQMYNINHLARPRLWGFAIFGGSNGYFKTKVLKQLYFDSTMLTEDIDLSLRALLSHVKIYFDRTIVSYERAPQNIKELWKQRVRWSQGWLQVSCKYGKRILCADSREFSYRQKIGLLLLLPVREWGQFICLQTLPLAIAMSVQLNSWSWVNIWLVTFIVLLTFLLVEPLWVAIVRDRNSANCTWFIIYALLSPFYMLFLKVVTLYAYFREIRGSRHFEVTCKAGVTYKTDLV